MIKVLAWIDEITKHNINRKAQIRKIKPVPIQIRLSSHTKYYFNGPIANKKWNRPIQMSNDS